LHNAIARIREALGDSAQNPRYIATLPRRGYRFIGEMLQSADGSAECKVLESVPDSSLKKAEQGSAVPTRMGRRRQVGFAIACASLIAFGLSGFSVPDILHPEAAPRALRSIAVLPLENLSGDSSQQCFVDGMTEQLITDLAKVTSLRVISRTSVMRYKGTKEGLPEIARELKVDGIVEGSVQRSGKRVRITVQLLHAPSDQHLWAETYERDLGDELGLQREVAHAIAEQVQARVQTQRAAQAKISTFNSRPWPVWSLVALRH
jgi:TolB-like protein